MSAGRKIEMISDERLEEIARLESDFIAFPPTHSECSDMAKELLALRKGSFMPLRLTAENGAKAALMGEFTEETSIPCTECFGDDECENCDGSGRILVEVPVSWTTIKSIYAKAVEHFQNAAS